MNMSNLRYYLTDYRTWAAISIIVLLAAAFLSPSERSMILFWAGIVAVAALLVWLVFWIVRRVHARRAARQLTEIVGEQATQAVAAAPPATRAETEAMRARMQEAIKAIKTSKLGQTKGHAALYELPWYIVIGNPAAGKSSAIANSGLRFPFSDGRGSVVQGLGGTRNCDWFFTTEGILLDTAGRYSIHEEDREEWLGFLDLLKKHRARAPINGILIAASIPELTASRPEFTIELAKNLRQRVQQLIERLEVFAPVYLVFTKADLIAGFTDFFHTLDPAERERVWGATLPFDKTGSKDAVSSFDRHFDELSEGLKEMSLAQMALRRGGEVAPGLLTLPLEFTAIKPILRIFIATLFEDNPYQFRPVFRGFYFTSALQEGLTVQHASEQIARRFGLQYRAAASERVTTSKNGYFLLDLFRKVIFADRALVRQYNNPARTRLRYAVFFGGMLALGLALAGWVWSYQSNRQLVANVQADLDKAVQVQQGRSDLQSRLQALVLLQDRLEQMVQNRGDHELKLGLGLYQGDRIETKLRAEYFAGMRALMLEPVGESLQSYLGEVVANKDALRPAAATNGTQPAPAAGGTYEASSPTDVDDAYNALKTYLMLGDRSRVEVAHLGDQLTRFWRGWLEANRGRMSREEMIRSATRLLSFYLTQAGEPGWPLLEPRVSLVDETRQALRSVMRGMPARDRVYAEIKQRAATRFRQITVASLLEEQDRELVVGSHTISGAFSRAAWEDYVQDAFKEAANKELSSTDWVLEATVKDDLTLAGSPEHIQKELVDLYKQEYANEWRRFMQGVAVADFSGFQQAVARMNRLGDPANSPLRKLLDAVYRETSWDNPAAVNAGLEKVQGGFVNWFQRVIMRRTPSGMNVNVDPNMVKNARGGDIPIGPVGREFAGVAQLMVARDSNPPLIAGYFDALAKIRTRLNEIKNQGDPGPGSRKLMQQTLDGSGSELSEALQRVDEQMLTGLSDSQRQTLRPLLLRPLIQAYASLIRPTEIELNRVWTAQVYEPFQTRLAQKYPFNRDAQVEASAPEIAQVFGPDGAIAKFSSEALGPLIVRRGNTLATRQWADLGISLAPALVANFAQWVAPLDQSGVPTAGGAPQTVFQLRPQPADGANEYTIELDGQQLRYRNTPPQWTNFIWPNPDGAPGARISAVAPDGRTVQIIDFPGQQGLKRLIDAAQRSALGNNMHQLTWRSGGITVSAELRIISSAQATSGAPQRGFQGLQLPTVIAGAEQTGVPPAKAEQAAPASEAAP